MAVEVRRAFHQHLGDMRDELVRLAALVTEAVPRATEVLLTGDLAEADRVIQGDDEIDARAVALEDQCYQLLALQQPMASDLRTITAAVRIVVELERSGDLCANLCKAARRIWGRPLDPKIRGLISQMGEQAQLLLRKAIDSFVDRDIGLAAAMKDMDDVLDGLHADFIQAIFETHAAGNLELQVAVQLAVIGRFYERIGDHAVNIGQRVAYMITGWLPEHTGAARLEAKRRLVADGSDGEDGANPPAGSN